MKTKDCCFGDCRQSRDCPLSQAAVNSRVVNYIVASVAACLLVGLLGVSQFQDEKDAQTAAVQVMACSEHPEACRAFEERHAAAAKNPRQ